MTAQVRGLFTLCRMVTNPERPLTISNGSLRRIGTGEFQTIY